MTDLHEEAIERAEGRLRVTPEARSMSQPEWLASQYGMTEGAVQHGVRRGVANAMALPQFVMDLADAPNTFISNVLLSRPRQDYFRRFDAASQAYGRVTGADEHEGFVRTPGNVAGDLMLQVGTETMMPLGGGYTALRAPKKIRDAGNGVADYLDPQFSESRREFGKKAAGAAAVTALGVPVAKKAMQTTKQTTQQAKQTAKVEEVVSSRWDKIVDETYDADKYRHMVMDQEVSDAATHRWATENNALDPESPPYNPKDYPPDVARKVDEMHKHETVQNTPFRRPSESRFLRDKDRNSIGDFVQIWDKEYDVRQLMGPENYDRLHELVAMGDDALRRQNLMGELEYLGRIKGEALLEAGSRQAHLLTPENRKVYDILIRKERTEWVDFTRNQSLQNKGRVAATRREIRDLMRSDPNVSAYRRERAKARAADIGDALWKDEYETLKDNVEYYKEHQGPLDVSSYRDDIPVELLDAERTLEEHIKLGERAGIKVDVPRGTLAD